MHPRLRFWWSVACVAVCLGAPRVAAAPEVVIAGSEILEPVLRPVLGQHNRTSARRIRLQLHGSRPGMRELDSGRAAVALLLARPGEEWARSDRRVRPFAAQVAVVVVPSSNPVPHLDFSQLAAIFGGGAGPSFRRWGDLGLGGEWVSRSIAPQWYARRQPLGGELFRHLVLRSEETGAAVVRHEKLEEALARLDSDAGAIAVVAGQWEPRASLRAVPVARATGDVAFGPTTANVRAGDYPLTLMVWLVEPAPAGPDAAAAVEFCESQGVSEALAAAGWVPAFGSETR